MQVNKLTTHPIKHSNLKKFRWNIQVVAIDQSELVVKPVNLFVYTGRGMFQVCAYVTDKDGGIHHAHDSSSYIGRAVQNTLQKMGVEFDHDFDMGGMGDSEITQLLRRLSTLLGYKVITHTIVQVG